MEITEELKNLAAQILEKSNHEVAPNLEPFTNKLINWIQELL